jgi:hypothetical protein
MKELQSNLNFFKSLNEIQFAHVLRNRTIGYLGSKECLDLFRALRTSRRTPYSVLLSLVLLRKF